MSDVSKVRHDKGLQTYETLESYQRAFAAAIQVHHLASAFAKTEWYGGMSDQIKRCSKGICANLAEGLAKQMSLADKRKFIQIALGSTEETRVWLAFAMELGYVSSRQGETLRTEYAEIAKMLFSLQTKLKF